MMSAPGTRRREPIFTMPGVVAGAIAVLIGIHALRGLLSDLTDLGLVVDFGFVPAQWSIGFGFASPEEVVSAASVGSGDAAALREAFARYVTEQGGLKLWSGLTYALLHGSWMHVVLNSVWLAAFATPVARRVGPARTAALAAACAVGGALAHWITHPLGAEPMIGASAIVSGLMAAAATFAFHRSGSPHGPAPEGRGLARIGSAIGRILRNRTALLFLASWFVINLVFGLVAAPLGVADASIAWEAHLGGLLAGLVLFPLLDPDRPPWHDWANGA
jgi:membrane associated rhomboid family serine protease